MNSDELAEIQNLLAELKQLEQELVQTTKNESVDEQDEYLTELLYVIESNKETIANLMEQQRTLEQDYQAIKQEEKKLIETGRQLQEERKK